jgi:hypothetical protein
MRVIRFGNRTVAVSTVTEDWSAVRSFLRRVTVRAPGTTPDLTLRIAAGADASLVVDEPARTAVLTVPETRRTGSPEPALHIGILQAAARCLALVVDHRACALLHGSAATGPSGRGVAVLDGGTGGGKTSLALALAAAGGQLVVDEFLLATITPAGLTMSPSVCLPWHVRSDMAPVLTPDAVATRLHLPDDLPFETSAAGDVPITAILVPDLDRRAGEVVPVEPRQVRRLLRPAVCDHRAKLLDPRLDHVSLFSAPQQITISPGVPPATGDRATGDERVLGLLAAIPTFVVGLGRPDDLAGAARAALDVLDREMSRS